MFDDKFVLEIRCEDHNGETYNEYIDLNQIFGIVCNTEQNLLIIRTTTGEKMTYNLEDEEELERHKRKFKEFCQMKFFQNSYNVNEEQEDKAFKVPNARTDT